MQMLKEEWQWEKFSLSTKEHVDICKGQWPRFPGFLFVAYRTILAIYVLTWFVVSFSSLWQIENLLVYLTNWTYFFLAVYLILFAVVCWVNIFRRCRDARGHVTPAQQRPIETRRDDDVYAAARERRGDVTTDETLHETLREKHDGGADKMATANNETSVMIVAYRSVQSKSAEADAPTLWTAQSGNGSCEIAEQVTSSILWLLFTFVLNASLIITVFYWLFIYPEDWLPLHIDINVHMLNSVFMMLDLFVCVFPVRLAHVIYCQAYGVVYLLFSLLYWTWDKKSHVIYPIVLDWNQPAIPLCTSATLLLVVVPAVQIFMFAMFKLKMFIYRKVYDDA